MRELTLPATISNMDQVNLFVEQELDLIDCPMKAKMQIMVAVEEVYVNIAHYAYSDDGDMTVGIQADPNHVEIRFTDSGKPFDPTEKDDPDITLSAQDRKIGGLGIYMVKKTMDETRYAYENGQNILTIIKNF